MVSHTWKHMLVSIYAASVITFLASVIRDVAIIKTTDVKDQQFFFLFFNAINFAALLPGTVVVTLARGELSASLALTLMMLGLACGALAASTLVYPNLWITVATVLLCVAITFPIRKLTIDN